MPTETPNSTKPSKSSHPQSIDRPDKPGDKKRSYPRWETFKRRPDYHLVSAGGIVYRNRGGRIEMFFIKDPFGRWSFPKGKIELGETLAETAVREIREETGLEGLRLIANLGKTSFRFWREAGLIEKTVHMFLFQAPATAKAQLTKAEAIKGGAWMPSQCAFQVSGYRNSDKLLGEAMRKIAEAEGVVMPLPVPKARKANKGRPQHGRERNRNGGNRKPIAIFKAESQPDRRPIEVKSNEPKRKIRIHY